MNIDKKDFLKGIWLGFAGTKPLRVYLDGCFDVMHYGHANALRQARMLGDQLVVGLISDDEIRAAKGPPVMNYAERKTLVASVKWVDEVIDGEPSHQQIIISPSQHFQCVHHSYVFPSLWCMHCIAVKHAICDWKRLLLQENSGHNGDGSKLSMPKLHLHLTSFLDVTYNDCRKYYGPVYLHADAPYLLSEDFLHELFTKHKIDYVVHGDDPCLLPDGTDAYAYAKQQGRFKMIKRTEGVSSTDIVGRMLMCTRDNARFHEVCPTCAMPLQCARTPG